MTYVACVPFEVERPLSNYDPDVRSISRLPGFLHLEREAGYAVRYTLSFEVEGGSRRDAMDAADELLVEYESAINAYRPRRLAALAAEAR